MVNVPSIDKKRLKWQGARLAVSSVIVGCIVFVLVDVFPVVKDTLSSFELIGMAFFAILASIFSLPFSLLGGYTLGWLLEKTRLYERGNAKVIGSGVIIATVTMLVMFIIGGSLQLCLMSHGLCLQDFATFMKQVIINDFSFGSLTDVGGLFVSRFVKILLIAMVCGGVTAWRLSRLAQE